VTTFIINYSDKSNYNLVVTNNTISPSNLDSKNTSGKRREIV